MHIRERLSGELGVTTFDLIQLVFRKLFYFEQGIMSVLRGPNQFIELQLHRLAVAVLRVLNQEHHQECHDGRGGIDDQLPRVAEVENRARDEPYEDEYRRKNKCGRPSGPTGAGAGKLLKTDFFSRP